MIWLRYGLPAVVVLAGVVLLALNPSLAGLEGWALLTGAGLAILLLNWLYRVGVKGDESATTRRRRASTSTSTAAGRTRMTA